MADWQLAPQAQKFQCKKCEGFFGAEHFYVSNQSTCKECVKERVKANRAEKIDYYRLYDRRRYRDSDARKDSARKSAVSEAGLVARAKSIAWSREHEPEKWKARNAVSNAIRDGRLARGTECFFCGSAERIQAHHHDYSQPLDVFWLCSTCHGKLHTVNGDFQRGDR